VGSQPQQNHPVSNRVRPELAKKSNPDLSFTQILESTIRGMIEFEGTNLRIYYAANEAPG
jgi:hypothetical protein